ncbi:RBZ zinc finger protein Vps36 [Schizosaccharomyces cryophilus OY26]|uniref:Vacuolar protein-sorting-associated protein 36 n=1 Tax=Schizosaccharomyces cryophilus (strain OY26 / ATCC MYA-4695 / CBS 11777 / NBRC 106824 / NRRL Y48691) TaxID=653667 RepID=S9W4V3_SCHCR|nr:RBZ zinc finger protein Vps36 [Schizosaccharomyces cryophilus OY26]EPY53559.1 RBZ zinc finger protein Vps36 [Schizosaccharomyces cryophilus OY26]
MTFYLETTSSNLPVLDADEEIIHAQNCVGLYFDDEKSPDYANGTLYISQKHVFYVDSQNAKKNSLKTRLSDIVDVNHSSRYFRSSPKVHLYLKFVQEKWACKICFYNNLGSTLDPCKNCGVAGRFRLLQADSHATEERRKKKGLCPTCTFQNYPDLLFCEICGTQLTRLPTAEHIQLSFRNGGSSRFFEVLNEQRKGLIEKKENALRDTNHLRKIIKEKSLRIGGIHGLQQSHALRLAQNGQTLVRAFQDLDAFFSLTRETMELADQFVERIQNLAGFAKQSDRVQQLLKRTQQLGLLRNNYANMVSDSSNARLFQVELCKSISELLLNHLKSDTDTITMTHAWAMYNRARKTELVSPTDFAKACELFPTLDLGIHVSKLSSGVSLFQLKLPNQREKFLSALLDTMQPTVTISQCAMKLHWSIGVTMEQLESAESEGYILPPKTTHNELILYILRLEIFMI